MRGAEGKEALPRLLGGTPTRQRPLERWPRLDEPEAEIIKQQLMGGPWAYGQAAAEDSGAPKREFERRFAEMVGSEYAVAVSSGTTALDLAVGVLGLRDGGVVVAANYGHPATIQYAARRHKLALVDVDPETLCLDPAVAERWLQKGDVRCVMSTDFAGQVGFIERTRALCARYGVPLVEDASHAHGARSNGKAAGSFGDIGCFSLHATKNLPTGEGGVIVTNRREWVERLWRLHNLGRNPKDKPYDFQELCGNHRMSDIHAAMGTAGLRRLDRDIDARMHNVERLRKAWSDDPPLRLLGQQASVSRHSFHVVAAEYRPEAFGGMSRTRFILAMCAEGIPCNAGWPRTLSSIPCIASVCEPIATPVADAAVSTSVWFDSRLFLDASGVDDIDRATEKIRRHAGRMRGER